jgi:hypothetical protein
VNITHTWFDSFTKVRKQSMSPTLDAMSNLYNYAVSCSRIVRTPFLIIMNFVGMLYRPGRRWN